MVYVKEANGSVDEVCERLQAATVANHFGVLGMINLKEKMAAKGVSFGPECRIFEVCNPVKAKTALDTNMAVVNALPCRISVYEERGKVKVSTLKPTVLLGLFGATGLEDLAREIETTLVRIIDEACR